MACFGSVLKRRVLGCAGLSILLLLAVMASPVWAAPVFGTPSPASGGTISAASTAVSLAVTDTVALSSAPTMTVDGTAVGCWIEYYDLGGTWYDDGCESWYEPNYDYTRGTIRANLTGLTNGSHTIAVRETDSAGAAQTSSWSFNVSSAPLVNTPFPAYGAWVANLRPTVTANVAANAPVASCSLTIDGIATSASYDPATKKISGVPLANLADGVTHTAVARVTDTFGLSGSLTWTFGASTTGPAISGQAPAPDALLGVATAQIAFAAADPSSFSAVSLKLDGVAVGVSWSYVDLGGEWYDDGCGGYYVANYDYTRMTANYTAAALKDGTHTVTAQVTGRTGIVSTSTWSFRVSTAPVIDLAAPANGTTVVALQPAISARVSDNGTVTATSMKVDGGAVAATYNATTKVLSYVPAAPLSDNASHTVLVTGTDDTGNTAQLQWSFWTKSSAPAFSGASPAPGSATPAYRPAISVAVSDGVQLSTTPSMSVDGVKVVCSLSFVDSGGTWYDDAYDTWYEPAWDYTRGTISYTPPADLANGTHTVQVDEANTLGAKRSYTWAFTVAAPPVLSSPVPANGASVATLSPAMSIAVKSNAGVAAAAATVDGVSTPAVWDATAKVVRVVPLAPFVDNTAHTVAVTITDGAGQSASYNWGFQTDVTGPTVGTVTPASGSTLPFSAFRIALDASDTSGMGGAHTMTVDGAAVPAYWAYVELGGYWVGTGCDAQYIAEYDYTRGTLSYYASNLSDGQHTVTAVMKNASGLPTTKTWTFTVAVPPQVNTPSPANGAVVATLTPSISARVTDNGTVATTRVTIDGVALASTYDPVSKTVSARPSSPLADESAHTVVVTATDAVGATSTLSWSFRTHTAAPSLSGAAPATSTAVWDPTIQIQGDDSAGIKAATMTLDGAVVPASLGFVDVGGTWYDDGCESWYEPAYDYTRGTVSYKPAKLSDGTHAVAVDITGNSGVVTTRSWSFEVAAPPKLSDPQPAASAKLTTQTPAISVAVAENSGIATVSATLDGAAVPAAYDAASGRIRVLPGTLLANDVDHRVIVRATDTSGFSVDIDWTFHIQIYMAMASSMGCGDCHTSVGHATSNCTPCHGSDCSGSGCHGSGHGVLVFQASECANCHPVNGIGHGDVTDAHNTTRDMSSCRPCHVLSLTTEHGRRTDPSGAAMTCASCHESANTKVTAAVAAGSTDCAACHDMGTPGGAGHLDQHTEIPLDAQCLTCHQTNLVTEHLTNTRTQDASLTCDTCHASADPAVSSAIAAGTVTCDGCHPTHHADLGPVHTPADVNSLSCGGAGCHDDGNVLALHATRAEGECAVCHANPAKGDLTAGKTTAACGGCHTTSGVDYHLDMAVHVTSPASYETCGHCHHAWGSNPLRGPDVTRHQTAGCRTCHNGTIDTASLTTECGSCHKVEGTDYHKQSDVVHTASSSTSLDCARCHETANVKEVHAAVGCDSCHVTYACGECHSMHMGSTGGLLAGVECSRCHATSGTDYHRTMDASHTFSAMDPSCQGSDCHTNALPAAHAAYVGTGSPNPQYPDTCALCHLNADPARIPAGASADCSSCHEIHPDVETVHTATSPASAACAGCHKTANVMTLHAKRAEGKCAVCHANPAKGDLAAGKTSVDCAGCHAAEGVDYHAGQATAHLSPTTSGCFGAGCHDASKSLPSVHALYAGPASENPAYATTCELCHQNADPDRIDWALAGGGCTSCHAIATHSQYNARHTPTAASANCVLCHGSDLTGIHKAYSDLTRCALCHANPANWSKTADCAGCHEDHQEKHIATGLPATVQMFTGGHTSAAKAAIPIDCALCHKVENIAAIHGNNCGVCHPSPRNSFTTWTGGCQQGSCHPSYHLNANAGHNAATSDCGVSCHVGSDFSKIDPGSCAGCHKLADRTAPNTTSDAKAVYVGPATVRFFPVDDISGVARTYWRLDGSEATLGLSAIAPQDPAGSVAHTLEFWSVDVDGNVEPTRSVSFRVDPDAVPPVSTSDAKAEYRGGATIKLSVTDNGSSLPITRYILDSAPATTGAVVNVTDFGGHTLRFWGEDAAGNVETAHVVTFTVSTVGELQAPVTSSDASASYTGTATISLVATDNGGSGVAATYWRLDGGAPSAGTRVVVDGPGLHTLEFWSVDREGNEELPHKTVGFSVLFPSSTGLIRFQWVNPPSGSWTYYYVYVYDSSNRLVASEYNTTGCWEVVVPVSATPYKLKTYWYDPADPMERDPSWSETSVLIDYAGKVVNWAY